AIALNAMRTYFLREPIGTHGPAAVGSEKIGTPFVAVIFAVDQDQHYCHRTRSVPVLPPTRPSGGAADVGAK
ncbi:hypothetical protein ABTL28_19360, partial [Acinetobacter baumannii]